MRKTIDLRPPTPPEPPDRFLRDVWREAGGTFFGPKVEHGCMEETKLLPFLRELIGEPAMACCACGHVGKAFRTVQHTEGDYDAQCPECDSLNTAHNVTEALQQVIAEREALQARYDNCTTNLAQAGRITAAEATLAEKERDAAQAEVALLRKQNEELKETAKMIRRRLTVDVGEAFDNTEDIAARRLEEADALRKRNQELEKEVSARHIELGNQLQVNLDLVNERAALRKQVAKHAEKVTLGLGERDSSWTHLTADLRKRVADLETIHAGLQLHHREHHKEAATLRAQLCDLAELRALAEKLSSSPPTPGTSKTPYLHAFEDGVKSAWQAVAAALAQATAGTAPPPQPSENVSVRDDGPIGGSHER